MDEAEGHKENPIEASVFALGKAIWRLVAPNEVSTPELKGEGAKLVEKICQKAEWLAGGLAAAGVASANPAFLGAAGIVYGTEKYISALNQRIDYKRHN